MVETQGLAKVARHCVFALIAAVVSVTGQGALAQMWQSHTSDNGSLVFGAASLSDHALSFACTAPSAQGLPLMQTGSHESHRSDPFEMYIGFLDSLFVWAPPYQQHNVVLRVGNTGFVLPGFDLNELQGTAVSLPMTHDLVQALYGATSLELVTPQGVVHRFPVAGLGAALQPAMRFCVDRWAEMGHRIPAALNRTPPVVEAPVSPQPNTPSAGIPRFFLPVGAVPTPPGLGALPQGVRPMPLPGSASPVIPRFNTAPVAAHSIATLPPVIPQYVRDMCGGAARIEDSALRHARDFDGDGVPDYVIHYTGVYCQPDNRRGFCGAANCSIEVFLSSRNYARPFSFLGLDVNAGQAADGRWGLHLSGTPFICADGFCDGLWVWNGQTFAQN